jgi:DNA modification methylase
MEAKRTKRSSLSASLREHAQKNIAKAEARGLIQPEGTYTIEQINDHITKDGRLKCLGCHHLMALHANNRRKCGGSVCKCQEFLNPHTVAEQMGLQKKGELVYFIPEEKKEQVKKDLTSVEKKERQERCAKCGHLRSGHGLDYCMVGGVDSCMCNCWTPPGETKESQICSRKGCGHHKLDHWKDGKCSGFTLVKPKDAKKGSPLEAKAAEKAEESTVIKAISKIKRAEDNEAIKPFYEVRMNYPWSKIPGLLKCLNPDCHHGKNHHGIFSSHGYHKCTWPGCNCKDFVIDTRQVQFLYIERRDAAQPSKKPDPRQVAAAKNRAGGHVATAPTKKTKQTALDNQIENQKALIKVVADSVAVNKTTIAMMPVSAIRVGPRYRKDLGDLQALSGSIKEVGLLHPIVVNDSDELIAGQRRLEACKLLGWQEVPVHKINLKQIVLGEFHENAVRKEFLVSEMVAIKRSIEPAERLAALKRMKSGKPSAKLSEGQTRDRVARFVNVSHATLSKAEKVVEAAEKDPATFGRLLEKIDSGNYSIDKAFKKLQRHEKLNKLTADNAKIVIPEGIKLLHGKFQDHAAEIENNSVDLIFTDPPYLREDLSIYEELAKLAARVLKPGGSVIAYTGNYALPEIIDYMRKADLTYWWTIAIVHESYGANLSRVWNRQVVAAWKPALWFVKGNKLAKPDFIKDLVYSKKPDKDLHDWAQSYVEAEHVIVRLTVEGGIVLDPMMGSGQTGIAAVHLKRRFIGIETLKDKYEIAKASISQAKGFDNAGGDLLNGKKIKEFPANGSQAAASTSRS